MTLRSADLDRRVQLERRVDETDDSGQVVPRWLPLAEVWAKVEAVGANEHFGAQQLVATGDLRFTIRWRGDVSPLHRVVHDGVAYDVVSVVEEGRRLALVIVARGRTERT